MALKVGDKVTVKIGHGGQQPGVVTKIHADGYFSWKNVCNFERRSHERNLTTGGHKDAHFTKEEQEIFGCTATGAPRDDEDEG